MLRVLRGIAGPASDEFIRNHRKVQPLLRDVDAG
jgi:hypothetical protein